MKVQFFTEKLPQERESLHIWLGKSHLPHDQLVQHISGQSCSIAKSEAGKPYFPELSLNFNLSDSESWISVAFSWRHSVGIDLEVIRPIDDMKSLIQGCFSIREKIYVEETDSLNRFWEIWNRKEAVFKALGIGLQDEMGEWDCIGTGWVHVKGVHVCSVAVQKGLSMAVAYHE